MNATDTTVRELGDTAGAPMLVVDHLVKEYRLRRHSLRHKPGTLKAVNDVSFTLSTGQALGLVGETGCGKSTLGRTIMRLLEPTSGNIKLLGQDVTHLTGDGLAQVRGNVQMVFQDPYASLDPRMTVRRVIAEPLRINHIGRKPDQERRVSELLELVGLTPSHADRYPHQLSGGQRQRVSIARALAMNPKILVLDEPVSALDVSLQAQIIGLLSKLREELGVSYLFISHDLGVVRYLCDTVIVMYLGQIVESGSVSEVFSRPAHAYTEALLSSVPIDDPVQRYQRDRIVLSGDLPSPSDVPQGCSFSSRCFRATEICHQTRPTLEIQRTPGHRAACHHPTTYDSTAM